MRVLRRFWLWGVVAALGLGYVGYKQVRLSRVAKAEPQEITCAELGRNGPGDNAHVAMTAYELLVDDFVVEASKRHKDRWSKVWIPAVPPIASLLDPEPEHDGPRPHVPRFHVIVMSSSIEDEDDLDEVLERPILRGLVINEVESLGKAEKKLLADAYPGTDLDRCWILHVDRTGTTTLHALSGAVALLLLSLYVRFGGRSRRPEGEAPEREA